MEDKKSIWPFAFTYGTALGLISVILSIIFYLIMPTDPESLQPKNSWIQTTISVIIIGAFLYWVISKYRDEELDGFISYGKSWGSAIAITVPFAIITAIYTYIFFTFIDADMLQNISNLQMEKMAEKGMSEEDIQQQMGWMNKMNSPIVYAGFAIFGSFFQNAIIGLITSIFTRKEPAIAE